MERFNFVASRASIFIFLTTQMVCLDVTGMGGIELYPKNVTIIVGQNVMFTCRTDRDLNSSDLLLWRIDEINVFLCTPDSTSTCEHAKSFEHHYPLHPIRLSAWVRNGTFHLHISNVQFNDTGVYTCFDYQQQTATFKSNSSAVLRVIQPSEVEDPTCVTSLVTSNEIKLTCYWSPQYYNVTVKLTSPTVPMLLNSSNHMDSNFISKCLNPDNYFEHDMNISCSIWMPGMESERRTCHFARSLQPLHISSETIAFLCDTFSMETAQWRVIVNGTVFRPTQFPGTQFTTKGLLALRSDGLATVVVCGTANGTDDRQFVVHGIGRVKFSQNLNLTLTVSTSPDFSLLSENVIVWRLLWVLFAAGCTSAIVLIAFSVAYLNGIKR